MRAVQVVTTADAGPALLADLRAHAVEAFAGDPHGDLEETDWQHALGGHHVVVRVDGLVVAQAAVVPRVLEVAARPLRTGYVEVVATSPQHRGEGHGSAAVAAAGEVVRERYALGALATGVPGFYARLGWQSWQGPTSVRRRGRLVRTPDDDGAVMVLPVGGRLDRTGPLVCDDRPGDVW